MASTPTVLSADNGAVSVPASGEWTAQGIAQVQALLNTGNPTTIQYTGGAVSTPGAGGGPYVLEVPNGTSFGTMALPNGYAAVIIGEGSSGTVTGGDTNTTILSAASVMSYTGAAGEIVQTATIAGTTGSISDSLAGATFDLGGGTYTLAASGDGQIIKVDNSASVSGTISGSNDVIQLGDQDTAAGAAAAAGAGGTGIANNLTFTGRGEVVTINSFNNIISDNGSGSTTIAGITGSSTIFAGNNDVYYGAGATTEFIASTGAQTVFGGTGNDTVFNGGAAVTYTEGSASGNFAVNASGEMTVYGNGAGGVFAGSGSTDLVLGNGNDVFVGGNGGSDSIYGGSVTPTVFGGSNEHVVLAGSHYSYVVAGGSNSVLDASLTTGDNNFFLTSATGNTTLVASSGPGDTFDIGSVAGGTAHTITIENWQTGDALFLGGYSAADVQTMDTAILGGKSSFTLSDGTTVTFTAGNQPSHTIGTAIF